MATAAGSATLAPSLLPDVFRFSPKTELPAWDGSDLTGAHLWHRLWSQAQHRSQWFAPQDQELALSLQLILDGAPPVPLNWFRDVLPPRFEVVTTVGAYQFEIGWDGGKVTPPSFAAPRFIAPVPLPSGLPLLLSGLALLLWRQR